ncbi:MAG: alpha/beta hydrolase [Actinomycetota bacterium]|nr:alpha/beta hydrolase [Actinomycetota bacterium]
MESGRVEGPLLLNGVELSWRDRGAGPPLLLLHETAATAAIWEPLIDAIGADARTIAPDRRGWGASGAPEQYAATTVEEQAADADALLREIDAGPAVVCGAGLGAVVALELLLRHRDLARGAVVVEPPLLAFLPEATQGLAVDRQRIAEAVQGGGPEAAIDLYLGGGLPHLGPGAERIPDAVGPEARQRPLSLFAELGTVPAWSLRTAEMLATDAPSRIVVGAATPALLRSTSEQLALRLGASELVDVGGEGLPHVSRAPELTRLIGDLL